MNDLSLRALDRYRFQLFAWLLAVVLGTLALFSYQTTNLFIDVMRPDFEAKAVLVSQDPDGLLVRPESARRGAAPWLR